MSDDMFLEAEIINDLIDGDRYNFAADLEDFITPPAYDPEKWPSKEAWRADVIEQGFYWVYDQEGGWDEFKLVFVGVPCTCRWCNFKRTGWNRDCVVHGTSEEALKTRYALDKQREETKEQ